MTPRKSEWMQLAESDGSTRDVRRVDKRLTLGTLAAVSAIIVGGSLFANAQDEPTASAEVVVAAPSASATSTNSPATSTPAAVAKTPTAKPVTPAAPKAKIQAPTIAQMPKGGGDDDENEGREGREGRGDHERRGEHKDSEEDDD